jgi:hypothetical protein
MQSSLLNFKSCYLIIVSPEGDEDFFNYYAFMVSRHIEKAKGRKEMKTEEIRQIVKTRYGKFAETGGTKESC